MPKPALMFALLVVVLDSVGFGLLIPVLPSLLEDWGIRTSVERRGLAFGSALVMP